VNGRLPVKLTEDRVIDCTTPLLQTTPTQFEEEPEQRGVTGVLPLHSHDEYADKELTPVAAARSHIIEPAASKFEGITVGNTDGGILGN